MHCWKCSKELHSGLDICPACNAPIDLKVVDEMETNPDGMADRVQILSGVLVNNRYVVKERIGKGGMGQVFLAHDETMGEDLALKCLPVELSMSPKAVTRLKHQMVEQL